MRRLLPLLLLAGCGSVVASSGGGPTEPGTVPIRTTAQNRALAQALVHRVLGTFSVYGGTAAVDPPAALAQPFSVAADPDQVVGNRILRVPSGVAATVAAVRAAPPPGFALDATGHQTGPEPADDLTSLSGDDMHAIPVQLTSVQVSFSVQAVSGDADASWLAETIEVDYRVSPGLPSSGGAVHVGAAQGCPASPPTRVRNPGVPLDRQFVPADPVGGLACAWYDNGGPAAPRSFDGAAAARIAAALRVLPYPLGGDGGAYSCPAGLGSALVVLRYAGGPDVDVEEGIGGCGSIDNGRAALQGTGQLQPGFASAERAIATVLPRSPARR